MVNSDLGHWIYDGEIPDSPFGFVYEITNKQNGRKYIGKKQMIKKITKKPLKGKKNKRHSTAESDWKTYTGSCNELNKDIETLGKDFFVFKILKFGISKSDLAYQEAKLQFINDVLLKEEYYNGIINVRIGNIKQ